MSTNELYDKLVEDFNLAGLPKEDIEEVLLEISKTIQKQFLLDVFDLLGPEKFNALQTSVTMGEEFYSTTLKHLVPNYDEVFAQSRKKVMKAFNDE